MESLRILKYITSQIHASHNIRIFKIQSINVSQLLN